ncbi:SCO3374 family protein [Streptomyces sp. NPDC020965]|uniref:SCO3374 family protein n=1 Tax=Streptomyces sp. NPDC020965 TaxID=3365105 RepID=UPI003788343D
MARTVPLPRTPLAEECVPQLARIATECLPRASHVPCAPSASCAPCVSWARWYESVLGWAVADGCPVRLRTGLRFDVLELPAGAGAAALRRLDASGCATGPVALAGRTMRLLVAAGTADELPGLLDWLEWGGLDLSLTALGPGGVTTAPPPPGRAAGWHGGRTGSREAAGWLRPPVPGREVEPTLPALAPFGSGAGGNRGGGPDLVRLLDAVATECHRTRLPRTNARAHGCANADEYAACEYSAD